MDARLLPPRGTVSRRAPAVLVVVAAAIAAGGPAGLADDGAAPVPFEPGELSIGEPIALPFGRSADGQGAAAALPADDPRADLPPVSAAAPVPGSGWLGLAVAESSVPGRWRVEEVAPLGPAARAGIAVGDELRAVNGVPMASAADVSQALTGIAAGQDVRVVVARSDQITDIVLRAEPRPPVRSAEPPRFVAAPPASPAPPPAVPGPPPAAMPSGAAPSPPAVAQTSAPQWQAATAHEPAVAAPDRFAPQPAAAPAAGTPPAVVPRPPAGAVQTPQAARGGGRTALGVVTVPIDAATQARFQLAQPEGAYVTSVYSHLPAAKAGVPPGIVIVGLGEQSVRSPEELTKLVTSGPVDRPVTVRFVLPGGAVQQTAVVLQSLDSPLERALTGAGTSATSPPTLQPTPRRAERPLVDEAALRTEVRALRGLIDRLERLIDPAGRRRP